MHVCFTPTPTIPAERCNKIVLSDKLLSIIKNNDNNNVDDKNCIFIINMYPKNAHNKLFTFPEFKVKYVVKLVIFHSWHMALVHMRLLKPL